MQLSIFCPPGSNVDSRALLEATEIRRDSTDAISEATVVFYHRDSESAYGQAVLGQGRYAFRPREWQSIEIRDGSNPTWDESNMTWNEATGTWDAPAGGTRQFAGVITQIELDSPPGGPTKFRCTCADYGILLDRIIINSTWPSGWTDQNIILDAFAGQTAVTATAGNIASIASDLGAIEAKNISLRELLDRICELTGGEWCVDYDKQLHYYTVGTYVAQTVTWDASTMQWQQATGTWDDQSLVMTDETGNHRMESLTSDAARMANRITVLGGFDANAAEISAVASNGESQNKYGILSATVVDRQITDAATADLRARAEVAQRAFPIQSGKFTTWTDGLDIGRTVQIRNLAYGVNGQFLIRAITVKQVADFCEYLVEFGQKQPDLITELRRAINRPKQPSYEPVARPAPGSVGVSNFASTIEPVQIVNALPALPDSNYSDNAVVLLTTDRKLYRRSGNTWTHNVNAADIVDQLQAGQLAADSVIAGTIAAGAIRAEDAVFAAAAIQRADLALAIIGDAQIDHATANRIVIRNADIDRATVNKLVVTDADIDRLSANKLVVTNADIQSLSASKLTAGTIDATTIAVVNLNASNITAGSLNGRTLTLTTGSVTTTISNEAIGSPWAATAGLAVATGSLNRTIVTEKGVLVFGGAVLPHAWFYTDAVLGGVLQVYSPGFASVNLSNGNVSCSGGYSSGGGTGATGSFISGTGKLVNVSGGLVTFIQP